MRRFDVTGMSCAACSARVEKAVLGVEGVTACSVNLLTNSMGVEGTATDAEIIKAVEKAGYGARIKGAESAAREKKPEDNAIAVLLRRLIPSVVLLIILMYFSMGATMWGFPLPRFLDNCVSVGLVQLLLAAVIMLINNRFFVSGVKGVIHRAPNMDTLVALGSGVAFLYSTYNLFAMISEQAAGNVEAAVGHTDGFYFEAAAMIVTLITVGKTLEAYSKGKTTSALKGLMALAPKTATVVRDGEEISVGIEQVEVGDVFVVRAGESIPVDGVVIDGSGSVDEAALTGESIPVDKQQGDGVSAATINKSGFMRCRATGVGEDTTLAQIIKTVSDAAATKAPIAKIADKVSGVFVPTVLVLAAITFVIWSIICRDIGFSLARGITVLVISCPCALGLATPVAIMVGSGKGARNGILFKTAVALENAGKVVTVALDKTGTVTKGEPAVTDIIPVGCDEEELLILAYSLEIKSEHPLAKAVITRARERGLPCREVEKFAVLAGNGLAAELDGKRLIGGSFRYVSGEISITKELEKTVNALARAGKTPLLFACGEELLGIIAVADVIKEDSAAAIAQFKRMGIRTVMLTGDNILTAEAIGKEAGVDEVIAGVLPDGKAEVIGKLQSAGRVAMIGDGINDAPALTRADIGIAIGAGTDIAIDSADVVLMNSRLTDAVAAIRLSRRTLINILENLFWAFIYNIIGIPLAAGLFTSWFGWELKPMFGAAAMSLSSFCVVMNALRLNLVNIYNGKHDRKFGRNKNKEKENITMTKTLTVEGMMCGHCEMHVKKALESLAGVASAEVSHVKGTAVVVLDKEISDGVLKSAVEEQGYKVAEIK